MFHKSTLLASAAFCLTLSICSGASAATVKCMFMSETTISKSGEWVKTETDFMKLMEMFGDGLELPLKNSVLGNLDTKQPFLAGEVNRGKVYLMGGDMGVEGKLISVSGEEITIYDGMCNVGFG
ncbi:hypothetical protein PsAD37_05366 [Pseudovibrio sp. Ad37]|nr:hypothetical protein PsAD37_05366 [Pseudovibrio sp. Ad37]